MILTRSLNVEILCEELQEDRLLVGRCRWGRAKDRPYPLFVNAVVLDRDVGNDPFNLGDPTGLRADDSTSSGEDGPCLFDWIFCPDEKEELGYEVKNPWREAIAALVDGMPGCAANGIANCFGGSRYVTTLQFGEVTGVAIVGGGGSGGTYQVTDVTTGETVDTGWFVAATASAGWDVQIVGGVAVVDGAPSNGLSLNIEGSITIPMYLQAVMSNNGNAIEYTRGIDPNLLSIQVGIKVTGYISDNGRIW